ncbi:MAG: ATP-binding protein [Spirochaetia bacterium]|jgi:lon-related putative ATP-dependent protease|nr:ATP-binding protein [Spirochaetia bacterium]
MDRYKKLDAKDLEYSTKLEEIALLRKTPVKTIIAGQKRATDALMFGTRLRKTGYNIFVTGNTGTGRHTAIRKILENFKNDILLKDIVCVFNFTNPENPGILYLPRGKAAGFKSSLANLITAVKKRIKSRIESDSFKKQKNAIIKSCEDIEKDLLSKFETSLKDGGFLLVSSTTEDNEMISDIMPAIDGKPIDFEELQKMADTGKLSEDEHEKIRSAYFKHLDDLQELLRKLQHNKIEMEDKLLETEKKFVEPVIRSEIDYLISDYLQNDVKRYLSELKKDILERLYLFIDEDENMESDEIEESDLDEEQRYQVNILVDNSKVKQAPVIFESYPTASNLFGTVENRVEYNIELKSNFMMVKAGSIIKASGGFLVLNAEDIFQEENTWDHLKRALKSGEVQIQQPISPFNPSGGFLKPEPVKIDTKIIIIGSENIYDVLYNSDEEFEKFFKVTAEFDSEMEVNKENTLQYIGFIEEQIKTKKMKSITDSGIQAVLDYGIRLTEHRKKYTTKFSKILDLLVESDYWASELSHDVIDRPDVETAIIKRNSMNSLPEEKLTAMMEEGTIKICVEGKKTGVVNGLAVYDRGFYTFGRPFLVSATVAPGDEGIINIEREAGLSGEIYNKAVMIIEGFVRSCYGKNFPVSMFASICFEQSYGEIEGDSASSTEIYALLSAITELPIRQDIAVTGSVNQFGQIQPIGGVNEKIEGFYSICEKFGLTGTQGVIIPQSNVKNLVLEKTVKEAVRNGKFSIYPISHINEGISILSGIDAGEADEKGSFPAHSFNKLVEKKLKDLYKKGK